MRYDLLATNSRRKLLFASLYLSEGAPIGFIWWALPTRLRSEGLSVEEITWLTALLVIPWTFKFAWAPLVDVVRTSRWTVTHWIVAAQVVMTTTLLPLLVLDLKDDFQLVAIFLFVHALSAATQDVAIDAWCISLIEPWERGAFNGWMQAGMLVGRSVMGGGALVMRPWIGDAAVIVLLALVTGFSMVLVLSTRGSPFEVSSPVGGMRERAREVWGHVRETLAEQNTWIGLTFAATAGAAYQAIGVVAGPFLIDLGYAETEVGWFFAIPTVVCMIAGALAGGWLSDRLGRRRFAVVGQLAIVIPACVLGGLAWLNAPAGWQMAVTATIYFGTGLFTTAMYALLMDLTRPQIAATQFSAFMGGINACEAWSGYTVGRVIGNWGYPWGFWVMALVSLATLPLLLSLRLSNRSRESAATAPLTSPTAS